VGEDTVRLAYGSYCWALGPPVEGMPAPCTDMTPPDDPAIPRLRVREGQVLMLKLAFDPTSLAVILGRPGSTRSIETPLQRELAFRIPSGFVPPSTALLVAVVNGSAGDAGAGQVTYVAGLTIVP
jgi:hypothetical protein